MLPEIIAQGYAVDHRPERPVHLSQPGAGFRHFVGAAWLCPPIAHEGYRVHAGQGERGLQALDGFLPALGLALAAAAFWGVRTAARASAICRCMLWAWPV